MSRNILKLINRESTISIKNNRNAGSIMEIEDDGKTSHILPEAHQRIKNHFITITALIGFQINAEKNTSAIRALKEAVNRINCLMVLYDRLYLSANYLELSIKEYLKPLVEDIVERFNDSRVKVDLNFDNTILNVRKLTALGIIVNELVTNAMKYAFVDRVIGSLGVKIFINGSYIHLMVRDNGVGLPESISCDESIGLGLPLVGMLVNQISGVIQINRFKGTCLIIIFPVC